MNENPKNEYILALNKKTALKRFKTLKRFYVFDYIPTAVEGKFSNSETRKASEMPALGFCGNGLPAGWGEVGTATITDRFFILLLNNYFKENPTHIEEAYKLKDNNRFFSQLLRTIQYYLQNKKTVLNYSPTDDINFMQKVNHFGTDFTEFMLENKDNFVSGIKGSALLDDYNTEFNTKISQKELNKKAITFWSLQNIELEYKLKKATATVTAHRKLQFKK